ncbi:hypothetical protein BDP27DRAFT_1286854 [Rhodocollybia butyracea]|uniref:Pentatricopeptide repeat-containing protein n=1 Tax=Rhodocollybia butyracea TaxID=206335 RepID=A0A9P5Q5N3_9AGAR|nr:hypothetical protein BDP27DRAFT_1286854 [Rhodocollybia butyracea]
MSLRAGLSRIGLARLRGLPKSVPSSRLFSTASSSAGRYLASLKADIQNTDVIHRDYPSLTKEIALSKQTKNSFLKKHDIESILEALAISGLPKDLDRIDEILSDMTKFYNLPPTSETHTIILRGLIQNGTFKAVKLWLENMPKKPGCVNPTLEQYHMVIEAGPRLGVFDNMIHLVRRIMHCKPTNETFKLLAQTRWFTTRDYGIPLPAAFTYVFLYMKESGLPYDTTVPDMISAMYLDNQHVDYAEEVLALYHETYSDILEPELIRENEWLLRIYSAVKEGGVASGLKLVAQYLEEGGNRSVRLLGAFMQRITRFDQLCKIRDKLGIEPSQAQWSTILLQSIKNGVVPETMECYNQLRGEGVMPTANAVSRMVQYMLATPSDDAIDNSIKVFTEFTSTLPGKCDLLPRETQRSLADLFSTMLREISQLSEEYAPVKESILREARSRKITLQNSSAYLTVVSMNSALSEDAAMETYRENKHVLDEAGYLAILDVLSQVSWRDRKEPQVPNISFYFEVVKDMKAARYPITNTVYLMLLRALARLAKRTSRNVGYLHLRARTLSVARQTHDLITLDSTISPNSTLWNALLNSYRLLEAFPEALRVWDTMYISRTFDRSSVKLILMACREAGGLDMARQIKTKLDKTGFIFDNYQWKFWIACLCDAGRTNEALRDMCTVVKDPDPEMAHVILDGLKPSTKEKVMTAIAKHHPGLYDVLLQEVQK